MKFYLAICITMGFIHLGVTQQKQFWPKDETNQDPSLEVFVSELKKAIATKDEEWIFSVLGVSVINIYGDEEGIESFKMYWSPENDSTDFWPYITRVVEMGGVFLHDTADLTGRYQFVFPYPYEIDLNLDDDYFLLGGITGKNVNLRSAPDTKSDVITQLTYYVIYYLPSEEDEFSAIGVNPNGDPEWIQITTYDKKYKGWVNWKYVYNLSGPRLFLFKDDKSLWKISTFVAGD